jgi:hypothetical protein
VAYGHDAGTRELRSQAQEGVEVWKKIIEAQFQPIALVLAKLAGGSERAGRMYRADDRRM